MASPNPTVLNDASISINGTAYTNWANHVEITDTADQVEVTGFSQNAYRSYVQGLHTAQIVVNFFQDFGAAGAGTNLDNILYSLYQSGGTQYVEIKPTEAAASTTNPRYNMFTRMYSYSPLNGDVGNASQINITFENAGTAGLQRGTS
jgi:hypothetical protein